MQLLRKLQQGAFAKQTHVRVENARPYGQTVVIVLANESF